MQSYSLRNKMLQNSSSWSR